MKEMKSPQAVFEAYQAAPPRTIEMDVVGVYPNLDNVPDKGRSYMLRGIAAFSRPGDVYRIDPSLRGAAEEQLQHLDDVGIPHVKSEDIIWSETFGTGLSGQYINWPCEVFFYDANVRRLRGGDERCTAVLTHESKCTFTELWQDHGYLPPTVVVWRWNRSLCPDTVWEEIGRASGRLKADRCASGNDQAGFASWDSLRRLMSAHPWNEMNYIVQRDVGDCDCSANYYADADGAHFLFATRQIIANGKDHKGNYPETRSEAVVRSLTDGLAAYAYRHGIRGFFGFDVRLDSETGQVWVIECNARITAPCYGWLLANKVGVPTWRVQSVAGLQHDTINENLPWPLRFDGRQGIVIHNSGSIASSRSCQLTVLGDTQADCAHMLEDFERYACVRSEAA